MPEPLGVNVWTLALYYSEHPADKFEFYGVKNAAMRFSFRPLANIIGFKVRIMMNGAASAICHYTLDVVMTVPADMIATAD